ncbi:MAG TPA: hypothetical protein VN809_13875 [Telmatospirillum sp.]|nr:hypothetical protein [Telmatospirillum sp.]
MRRVFASGMLYLLCLVLPGLSNATTLNELKVEVRVIDFMTPPPRGKTALAVLYDAQNTASVEDARVILAGLRSGVGSAKAELVPSLVDVRRLDEFPGFHVAILASGSETFYNAIFDYAQKNQTLTISSDVSCIRLGKCAVGVTSVPRVDVVINRAVISSSGIEFSEAFRMMVREY